MEKPKSSTLGLFKPGLLRTHFPYAILMFANSVEYRDSGYFILNRYYSCLGTPSQDLRNVMPIQFPEKEEKELRELAPYTTPAGIWMYDDATAPWESTEYFRAYMDKLEVLASCTFFKEEGSGAYVPWYSDEDCRHPEGHTLPAPVHGLDRAFYKIGENFSD